MYKVLAIDDEMEICKVIEAFLTKKGFCVLTAYSGEESLKIIEKEKPDLVVLDKRMPGIGGVAVLRELVKRKDSTPVIVLSGSEELSEHAEELKDLGYDDILIKPIDLKILLERINKRLAGK